MWLDRIPEEGGNVVLVAMYIMGDVRPHIQRSECHTACGRVEQKGSEFVWKIKERLLMEVEPRS